LTPRRSWFNHAFQAPLSPGVGEALASLLAEIGEGPLPAERRRAIRESAREAAAAFLGVPDGEIVLTAGGTEAANLAIKGAARALGSRRIVATAVEHLSVLHPIRSLARQGWEFELVRVDPCGRVDLDALRRALATPAALVSVQHANHEVGTVQPVEEAAAMAHGAGALLHVDAAASAPWRAVPVGPGGADLVSLSGAPLGALPGSGALRVREGVRVLPLVEGGTQEGGRRAGELDPLALRSLDVAARRVTGRRRERWARIEALRDRLEAGLGERIGGMTVQGGGPGGRLPGHLHASFPGAEGEALLFRLRRAGVEASTGSTCAESIGKPSHVLEAMDLERERIQCSLLLSLGPESRDEDVDRVLDVLPAAVQQLRTIAGG
jgi:cysteine desulfurase